SLPRPDRDNARAAAPGPGARSAAQPRPIPPPAGTLDAQVQALQARGAASMQGAAQNGNNAGAPMNLLPVPVPAYSGSATKSLPPLPPGLLPPAPIPNSTSFAEVAPRPQAQAAIERAFGPSGGISGTSGLTLEAGVFNQRDN